MTEKAATEKKKPEQKRVSKREFLARVSATTGIPLKTINVVYEEMREELLDTMRRNEALMLTGFGKFYPQSHKGHRVQFAKDGDKEIEDYFVLKFSSTSAVNKSLLEAPREERATMTELFEPLEEGEEIDEAEFEPESRKKPKRKPKLPVDHSVALAAAATQSTRKARQSMTKAERDALRPPVHLRAI